MILAGRTQITREQGDGQKTGAAVQKKNDGDWTGRSQQRRGEARHLVTCFGSSISRTAGRWAVGTERAKN